MGEKKYWQVKLAAELTVSAETEQAAKDTAINAVVGMVGRSDGHAIRGALVNQDNFTAEEREFDPEEIKKFMHWYESTAG